MRGLPVRDREPLRMPVPYRVRTSFAASKYLAPEPGREAAPKLVRLPFRRHVNGSPEGNEAGFLDRLAQSRVRRHPQRERLDRRFSVDGDPSDLYQLGRVRPDNDQPEQPAVT